MNFKINQKVVCIDGTGWYRPSDNKSFDGPKTNEVVTVSRLGVDHGGENLSFVEYPQGNPYRAKWFRPLDELSAIGINDLLEILPFEERKVKINI